MSFIRNSKFIFNTYKIICNLYTNISTFLENKLLKINKSTILMDNVGCFKYTKNSQDFDKLINYKHIRDNKYKQTRYLKSNEIYKLINYIFDDELKKFITYNTGFNYSIDHFWFYEREKINKEDRIKQWYAHEYHFDKPYSKNMLKIFLPINVIDNYASLSILDRQTSLHIKNINMKEISEKFISVQGKSNNIYGFFPRVCWHKDGIPKDNEPAIQMMFQLNPAKKWCMSKYLEERQLKMEGRFPFFAYFLEKRRILT